eukprot:scaffold1173_cov405-Prasinococcus_capsulatus_cf.AAC.17
MLGVDFPLTESLSPAAPRARCPRMWWWWWWCDRCVRSPSAVESGAEATGDHARWEAALAATPSGVGDALRARSLAPLMLRLAHIGARRGAEDCPQRRPGSASVVDRSVPTSSKETRPQVLPVDCGSACARPTLVARCWHALNGGALTRIEVDR